MYDPGSDSYPDSWSLEHSYRAMFAHPLGQMEYTYSAQSFDRSSLSALCSPQTGSKNAPVEEVVVMLMSTNCQQGLMLMMFVVNCIFLREPVSDNQMRNESLLFESDQFPFL